MAAFLQSLSASGLPKRMLRYALSRLELLDSAALDVDNLDLSLGMKTVLEFRDVGLKIKRLESLLSLPDAFTIRQAKILSLRVTMPIDFYTSPILVEIDGVEVTIDAAATAGNARAQPPTRPWNSSSSVLDATDLAQSFLETQPQSERSRLQEALDADGPNPASSIPVADDGSSEDDSALGTGQPLSLPDFLAGFLQGVVDRTQVKIKSVKFLLDTDLFSAASALSPESVSIQLTVGSITVEGITNQPSGDSPYPPSSELRKGSRHVTLTDVHAYMISDVEGSSDGGLESGQASTYPTHSSERAGHEPSSIRDSEEALGIPYDLSDALQDEPGHGSTPTVRASTFKAFSAVSPIPRPSTIEFLSENETMQRRDSSLQIPGSKVEDLGTGYYDEQSSVLSEGRAFGHDVSEDSSRVLACSMEEPQSMYMSALSHAGTSLCPDLHNRPATPNVTAVENQNFQKANLNSQRFPKAMMPGAWGDDLDGSLAAFIMSRPIADGVSDALPPPSKNSPSGHDRPTVPERNDTPSRISNAARKVKQIMQIQSLSVSLHQGTNTSNTSTSPPPRPSHGTSAGYDGAVEIAVSPIRIDIDKTLGALLMTIFEKLSCAAQTQQGDAPERKSEAPPRMMPSSSIKVEGISLNLVKELLSVPDASSRPTEQAGQEVLLHATMRNLVASVSTSASEGVKGRESREIMTKATIDLENFRLGYSGNDIITFNDEQTMIASATSHSLPRGKDICIRILRSAEKVSVIDIETLPLVSRIDLKELDEVFGRLGGLSSFLSMSSSSTRGPLSKATTQRYRHPQGPKEVHFEPSDDARPKASTSRYKVNTRIGGLVIELVGAGCSIIAETSAVKSVYRGEGIGATCGLIRISGPYLIKASPGRSAASVEVSGIRMELSAAPRDKDLESLLELIIPSKIKFDKSSDEIMVDTLLRQRRNGSVLRTSIEAINVQIKNPTDLWPSFSGLGSEISKLSEVANYLPEDNRPGLLSLISLQRLAVGVHFGGKVGQISGEARDVEVAHITIPSLAAVAVHGLSMVRNGSEELVNSSPSGFSDEKGSLPSDVTGPVFMARMIGDELDPTIKLILQSLRMEYRAPTIMDLLDLDNDATPQDFEQCLASSVAMLSSRAQTALLTSRSDKTNNGKPITLDATMHNCLLGLSPFHLPSKMIVALTDACLRTSPKDGSLRVSIKINKASVLLTNDATEMEMVADGCLKTRQPQFSNASSQVADLCAKGFVDICYISSANAIVSVAPARNGGQGKQVVIELQDDLLVLETCADSTQTLISLVNALKPPTPPSRENRYRTEVVPVDDLLASISAEAFGKSEGLYDFDQDFACAQELIGSVSDAEEESISQLAVDSRSYGGMQNDGQKIFDAQEELTASQDSGDAILVANLDSFSRAPSENISTCDNEDLEVHEDFYEPQRGEIGHTAKVWNSSNNSYDKASESLIQESPFTLRVRDVHIIWNLFDGFDWARTREAVGKAVEDVENKALERRSLGRIEEDEDQETIGDFLFNSIYIGIPANRDPGDLARAINRGIDENLTETDSIAPSTLAGDRTVRQQRQKHRSKSGRLRLGRSKHHKITFELRGVDIDLTAFGPGAGETLSGLDIRIRSLDVFDHVPTSTWKKLATYDQDEGEREMGASMVHLEVLNVKPVADLAASEMVLRATVLPLRLHVDQDAFDFIARFFEFRDDDAPAHASMSDVPFIQRAEVNDIAVKLDFKPKRVDYAGLRSGHTTELMNFVMLEEARMVLRRVIVYGISGLDRLGRTLHDIWLPDVRRNQLPSVAAGLAPVRHLVNIGSGFRDLVEIPLKQYRQDGRVVRGISKGAASFARTTGTELVKLGAKIAVGTQHALQGAEDMLMERPQHADGGRWEEEEGRLGGGGGGGGGGESEEESGAEERKQISPYAHQPTGVMQGIRGGYRSLARDINLARDAIVAVPGEVMDSRSPGGAARAVWRRAPTIILRPAVGVSKAIGQTLMGATNTIDPNHKRRIDEKYKH